MSRISLFLICQLLLCTSTLAAERYQRVQIAESYIELHTAAGRGFPIFHVIERGEWVEVLKRKTDWFLLRSPRSGVEGWADRRQMESTLTEAGIQRTFRDVLVEDFLKRRTEFGLAGGSFEGDSVVTIRGGYRFTDNLSGELSFSRVAGRFSNSTLYHANIVSQPFPDWRISPYFTIGAGRFKNDPRGTLVAGIDTENAAANAGIGVRIYLRRNFMLRLDYKNYVVLIDDNRNNEFDEVVAGVSFFF